MKTLTKKQQDNYRKECGNDYRRRLKAFGKRAKVCFGCSEILLCGGPISFEICQTLDEMIVNGLLKKTGRIPKWMHWATRIK